MDANILISLIIGIIVGYLISDNLINPQIIHGPNSADIVEYIYEIDNRKYRFEPRVCPSFIKFI